jgi:hypothetical protein
MSHALFFALLVASPIAGLSVQNAGITKVIQMLGDMSAKSKQEKNKEQVAFAEFQTWCKMEIPQTQKSIAKAAENIDLLNAEIAKLTSEARCWDRRLANFRVTLPPSALRRKMRPPNARKTTRPTSRSPPIMVRVLML